MTVTSGSSRIASRGETAWSQSRASKDETALAARAARADEVDNLVCNALGRGDSFNCRRGVTAK
jgi:hypothetical protein